jgi:ubiquinone/menaquinone biosynthesis C-methylase UbiE
MMSFTNVYSDAGRAESYAGLEFPGTYYLAYRDLPAIIGKHVTGNTALDFGCGTGRSTRFLKRLGFNALGIDISSNMIRLAQKADTDGSYQLVEDGNFNGLGSARFDLVLSAFAFDNIPGVARRCALLRGLRDRLSDNGRIIILASTPEIYIHEWASFTTKDFPENLQAKSGDAVKIVMKDVADQRPVVDIIWFDDDYRRLFEEAGLETIARYAPVGRQDEPYEWIAETEIAPWVIYIATKNASRVPGAIS